MTFYRVQFYTEKDGSQGYEFFTTKFAAQKYQRESWDGEGKLTDIHRRIEQIEVKATKAGILQLLQRYASHADNG